MFNGSKIFTCRAVIVRKASIFKPMTELIGKSVFGVGFGAQLHFKIHPESSLHIELTKPIQPSL